MRRGRAAEEPAHAIDHELLEFVAVVEPRRPAVGLAGRRPDDLEKIVGGMGDRLAGRPGMNLVDVLFNVTLELAEFRDEGLGLRAVRGGSDLRQFLGHGRTGEDAVEGVVVGHRHRLVLVVMAAGAGHGESHESPGDQVDLVIDDVVAVAEKRPADRQEPEGREIGRWHRRRHEVGRELERDEPVVGHVGGECADDPVAVGPGERVAGVLTIERIAHRVGVAGEVEPLPGPVLGMLGGGEQPVDELAIPGVGGIGAERIGLVGGRRQAGEVEPEAAHQITGRGLGRRRQAGRQDPGADEAIDGRLLPGGGDRGRHAAHASRQYDGRRRGRLEGRDRPERPMGLAAGCEPRLHLLLARRGRRVVAARAAPGESAGHPRLEHAHFVGGEPVVGGHGADVADVPDRGDEPAVVGVARHDHGARVAAGEQPRTRVEPEARLRDLRPVARLALLHEQRPHPRLEELLLLWRHGLHRGHEVRLRRHGDDREDRHEGRGKPDHAARVGRGHGGCRRGPKRRDDTAPYSIFVNGTAAAPACGHKPLCGA